MEYQKLIACCDKINLIPHTEAYVRYRTGQIVAVKPHNSPPYWSPSNDTTVRNIVWRTLKTSYKDAIRVL